MTSAKTHGKRSNCPNDARSVARQHGTEINYAQDGLRTMSEPNFGMVKDFPLEPNAVMEIFLRYAGLRPELTYRPAHKNHRIPDDPRFREPRDTDFPRK